MYTGICSAGRLASTWSRGDFAGENLADSVGGHIVNGADDGVLGVDGNGQRVLAISYSL